MTTLETTALEERLWAMACEGQHLAEELRAKAGEPENPLLEPLDFDYCEEAACAIEQADVLLKKAARRLGRIS